MKRYNYILLVLLLAGACRKSSYNTIPSPSYIRVFNSLNYIIDVTNKDQPPPFLAMVIDPVFDGSGQIIGAGTLGDFLDKRSAYAPPYPANAGSTSFKNTEYPGSAKVLAAPILNGVNLASWAQIPSGKHRIQFYSRPISPQPFFTLSKRDKQGLILDTTVNLTKDSIYTMEVVQTRVTNQLTVPVELYIRQEQFANVPFSENQLYVNFYNLSAQGYAAANQGSKQLSNYYFSSNTGVAWGDTLNIFYSLLKDDCGYPYNIAARVGTNLIPGYNNIPLGNVIRTHTPVVAPYYAIPIFAAPDTTGGILSMEWEQFLFLVPGRSPAPGPIPVNGGLVGANPQFGAIGCSNVSNDGKGSTNRNSVPSINPGRQLLASAWLPNLIKYTASGTHAQQSFSTISTIEIINNQVYLMSVQRTYPPPSY